MYFKRNPIRWGKAGAGILFFCDNEILLGLRSQHVDQPYTWGIPGGSVSGETWEETSNNEEVVISNKVFWEGAIQEVREELGSIPDNADVFDKVTYYEGSFIYVTFLARITKQQKENWKFILNWENSDARWFSIDKLPNNLHFGIKYVITEKPENFINHIEQELVLVNPPDTVFQGTSLENLENILNFGGLTPGGGFSPHRTKTVNALFYASEFEAAILYSSGGFKVVLEIDSTHLKLQPDWDDAAVTITVDLEQLNEELGMNLELGGVIPEDIEDDVEEAIQDIGEWAERAEPTSLSVVQLNDTSYLIAEPYVCIGVDATFFPAYPELYDYDTDLCWEDNNPCFLSRQFMSYEDLDLKQIRKIWIEKTGFYGLNISETLIEETGEFTDYGEIIYPDDLLVDGSIKNYEDPRLEDVQFKTITMFAINPFKLREAMNSGQTFFWRA